jgi:predicted Zn-dependent protease
MMKSSAPCARQRPRPVLCAFAFPLLLAFAPAVHAQGDTPASAPAAAPAAAVPIAPVPPATAPTRAGAIDGELLAKASALAYRRELARAKKAQALDLDALQVAYARRIAAPLVAHAAQFDRAAAGWQWSIHVETRDDVLAWCLPGGQVMLSSALFAHGRFAAAEIAAVLAHTLAHGLAGHDAAEAAARFAVHPDATSPDPNRRLLTLADLLAGLLLRDPYPPDQERDADMLALDLLARSGFDPKALLFVWKRLGYLDAARAPAFVALHPRFPERIAALEARLPAATAVYERVLAERAAQPSRPASARPPAAARAAPRPAAPAR